MLPLVNCNRSCLFVRQTAGAAALAGGGRMAAASLQRSTQRGRAVLTYGVLGTFVLGYAAAWFLFNLGACRRTYPKHRPIQRLRRRGRRGLAVVASGLVLLSGGWVVYQVRK